MKKWNLIVDIENCTNCNVCTVAVQDEHVGNSFPGYSEEMPKHGHRWIEIMRKERGAGNATDVAYLPTMCQHCDDAPCIKSAPDVVRKRPDGIVIIDPEKAKGRKDLVDSCPYGAIWWNEEKQLPQHWIFDAHLLDAGWKEPRCVTVCATKALQSVKVDDDEMARLIDEQQLDVFHAEYETKPRVYYKNLWRYTSSFIAGSLSGIRDHKIECLEGVEVQLVFENQNEQIQRTDVFGDFKFDKLDAQGQTYQVQIIDKGEMIKAIDVILVESVNIGEIVLV